ncbi:MAG: hypothetical protein HY690_01815 [Chloroflexi bacterium]|nr:hypothetical protein [Chloroflexota bacterium]
MRDRIKTITAPQHGLPEPIGPLMDELNRLLRGWGAYFRVGNATRQFQQADRYVRLLPKRKERADPCAAGMVAQAWWHRRAACATAGRPTARAG